MGDDIHSRRLPPAAPRTFEKEAWAQGLSFVAGVDEAGRGALAGPVVAAAVIFRPETRIAHVTDSKLLRPRDREYLAEQIKQEALAWTVGLCGPEVIDAVNILQATRRAMREALSALTPAPELALVDGWEVPELEVRQIALVKGDSRSYSIAAASIIAKTTRDQLLRELHEEYPVYGFADHKGYATAIHLEALHIHGACPAHRLSFAPVSARQYSFEFEEDGP